MAQLVEKLIKIARDEIGVHEGKTTAGQWNNDQKYSAEVPGLAWSNFQPWCATFVSWVAFKAGAGNLFPRTASCDLGGAWFKSKKRWSEYPAIGAQAFYGTARDLNHTGIVIDYDEDYILTVEGNTNVTGSREGDGVYLKKRLRRSANVVGYGYPDYPEGIKSADPAWSGVGKRPVTTPPKPNLNLVGNPARIDGVDLSHHNSGITLSGLKQAKAAGVRFVVHKATEGTGFTDAQYATRRRLCAEAKIPFGAYHFARPGRSSGTVQARQYLAVARLQPRDLLPVLDLEDEGGLSFAQLGTWVGDFVTECQRQLGHDDGIIYTPFNLPRTYNWKLWVARYSDAMPAPKVPMPWSRWDIWQFSNGVAGRPSVVPGIGHCDINTLAWAPSGMVGRLRLPEQKKPAKPTKATPAPATPVTPASLPAIPPAPATPPATTGEGLRTFRNVQCNVQQTDPAAVGVRHVNAVSLLGDVIGWNELGKPALVDAVKALSGFTSYGPTPSSAAVAISWRTALFEHVDSGHIVVHKGVPRLTPTRVITWVRLRHLPSGKVFTRINTQVNHHIEVAGKPRVKGALLGQNDRAKRHFELLHDIVAAASKFGPVVTGGDFNVCYLAEKRLPPSQRTSWFPYTVLGRVATPAMVEHGTHGGRAIDWTLISGNLTRVSQQVLPHGSSDHNPVQTVLRFV